MTAGTQPPTDLPVGGSYVILPETAEAATEATAPAAPAAPDAPADTVMADAVQDTAAATATPPAGKHSIFSLVYSYARDL